MAQDDAAQRSPTGHPGSELELGQTLAAAALGDGPQAIFSGFQRYHGRGVLGAGGMGEVRLVTDECIGRDVAMKTIRAGVALGDGDRARFVREARVQGQLEHPAIVPVYDLGLTPSGEPYFTMKRVRGITFEEIVRRVAAGDEEALASYGRRRLLSAFSSACLAVELANGRGVLHRDLKPANIMLGDFGEVYVLDWGIAKVVGDTDAAGPPSAPQYLRAATQQGAVLGTPGYMAPEQVTGGTVDARADVYALGCILFEILTAEPIHAGDSAAELLRAPLRDSDERAREVCRAKDVPPELEAICLRATARAPSDRFASARELERAIEKYLDGDRDLARRRAIAGELAAEARTEAERALSDAPDAAEARRRAMRTVGRALALDPDCEEAAETLVRLMTTPPETLPAEVEQAIADETARAARTANRAGALGYLTIAAMLPFLLWMGVRERGTLAAGAAVIAAGLVVNVAMIARPRWSPRLIHALLAVNALLVAISTRILGPVVGAPTFAVGLAVTELFHPHTKRRWLGIGALVAGFLAPFALEGVSLLSRSYEFGPEGMTVRPWLVALPEGPTLTYLALTSTAVLLSVSGYLSAVRDALGRAQRTLHIQSWQLRQMVPRTTLEAAHDTRADG